MKESDIVQKGAAVLRQTAQPVPLEEINSKRVQSVIADMRSALHDTADGVAIAAPQIGASLRIFLVRGAVFAEREDIPNEDKVFINPEITSLSEETTVLDEGCLSVRGKYGKISRHTEAGIHAYDEGGDTFAMAGRGLLAQIFQHETDHLDGKLFIDEATDVRDAPDASDERE